MAILTKKPAAAARRQVEDFIDSAPDGRASRPAEARPARQRTSRSRDKIFSFALSEAEHELLEILATQAGISRGMFMRNLLIRAWAARN